MASHHWICCRHNLLLSLCHLGSQHGQLLQKALLSAELSLGLLKMKNVDKNKAVQQALQKHVEVNIIVCLSVIFSSFRKMK